MLKLPRPVSNEWPITSGRGPRPVKNERGETEMKMHEGYDFGCPVGTPVHAVADGVVYKAGWENEQKPRQGLGLRIWQEATVDGVQRHIWYGHTNQLLVKTGEKIVAGQVIAYSGATGASRGPHLHFQVCPVVWDAGKRQFENAEFFWPHNEKAVA